jgi:sulfofructose kinase
MSLVQAPTDILGLGSVAVDDVLYVADYPRADSKTPVRRRERHCGGLTATALVAASRLGARCSYAGTLGDDDLCRFILDRFRQEAIEVTWVRRREGARPIHSVVVVDERQHTRTILYDLHGFNGAEPDWPEDAVIRSARLLFVDHIGLDGMIRAARIARSAGIPVVADLEGDEGAGFTELLSLVDHLILSRDFARKVTGQEDPGVAALRLWRADRQAVVITCGSEGCCYVCSEEPVRPRHQPAFEVEAVDTTGCGDVFHGAYAAALVQGLDVPARIRLASAAAALKATQSGGQAGIPTRQAVEAFLKERAA